MLLLLGAPATAVLCCFRANVRSGLTKMSTNRSKSFQFCHLWQKISRILDFGSKADCLPGADTIPRRRSRTNLQCCTIGSRPRGLLLRGNPYCWPIVVGNPYCCSVVIVNNNNNKPPLTLHNSTSNDSNACTRYNAVTLVTQ